jgi:hypothetical protein
MEQLSNQATGNEMAATDFNQLPKEIENAITSAGLALSSGDTQQLVKTISAYAAGGDFYTDSGAANAYVLTPAGSKISPPAFVAGMRVRFRPANANTGASTVNVNGSGAVSITRADGSTALAAGDLSSSYEACLVYDGSVFRILGLGTSSLIVGSAAAPATRMELHTPTYGNGEFRIVTSGTEAGVGYYLADGVTWVAGAGSWGNTDGFSIGNTTANESLLSISKTGAVTIPGSFAVGGAATVSGGLNANSVAISGSVTVGNAATASGSLTVNGINVFPVGAIHFFPCTSAPSGFLIASGQSVAKATYASLYAFAQASGLYYSSHAAWLAAPGGFCDDPNTSDKFLIPDLRGYFLRAYDDGAGVDSGRTIGTTQDDAFQGHIHDVPSVSGIGGNGDTSSENASNSPSCQLATSSPITDGSNGTPRTASETRPKNIALLACIKY